MERTDKVMERAREDAALLQGVKRPDHSYEIALNDEQRLAIQLWANHKLRKTMRVPLGPATEVQMRFFGRPKVKEWERLRHFIDMCEAAWADANE